MGQVKNKWGKVEAKRENRVRDRALQVGEFGFLLKNDHGSNYEELRDG
jgi:hypothetical protein